MIATGNEGIYPGMEDCELRLGKAALRDGCGCEIPPRKYAFVPCMKFGEVRADRRCLATCQFYKPKTPPTPTT